MRADKDPRDYMGMTVDESELPLHFDGFFVGYASHSTVILVYDPETETVKRCHHGYVDEYNVRVLCTLYSHAAPNGQNEPEWQILDAPKCIVNTDFGIKAFAVHDAINGGPSINLSYKTDENDPTLLLNHYQLQSRE